MKGRKVAKSAGNFVTISDLVEKGYYPLAFRYLTMTARYRSKLSFSLDVLEGAQTGLRAISSRASRLAPPVQPSADAARALQKRFEAALAGDLHLANVPPLLPELLGAHI